MKSEAGAGSEYHAQGLGRQTMMNCRRTLFCLVACFVINGSVCLAQSGTLNLVYSGVGGLSDVVKFAHQEGFFKKNGLDTTLIYVNSGVLASQVVASGTAGAAAITATDALRVMSAGVPMKIIMVNIDQFQHLFVARPGIKNPGDMKGKKVAVSRYGSFSDIQTRFLIRQWGMDPDKDVQILQIGNSAARAAALASGGVDGAIVTPFFIPAAKKAGLNVIFDLSTINARFANQIVIVNDNLIKEKRAVVRALARGLIEAIRVWRAGSEATRAYLRKNYKLADSDIENIEAEGRRFIRAEPTPDLDSVQAVWDSTPDLKARGVTDFGKFVDGSFVADVLRGTK
jgi:ABC-type nitrate/sulfonate/bicarbonate transport system substrate-binding protein